MEPEKAEKIRKFVVLCDSLVIIIMSILRYVYPANPFSLKDKIWTFYWIVFGLLLAAGEFQIQIILEYFNFLKTRLGKAIFHFFIGTIMLTLPWFVLAIGISNLALGAATMYLNIKYTNSKELPQSSSPRSVNQPKEINMNKVPQGRPIRNEEIIIDN